MFSGITTRKVMAANEKEPIFVTVNPIGGKEQGDTVTISGSTSLEEVSIKVIAPDNTVLYFNVVSGTSYEDSFELPTDAVTGAYTAVVGQGATVATTEFTVSGESIEVPVTGVSLEQSEISLKVGKSKQLTATITPVTATNKNVSWASSNEDVAKVGGNGKVTGKSVGTARITVTTEDRNYSADCEVTVRRSSSGGGGSSHHNNNNKNEEETTDETTDETTQEETNTGTSPTFSDVQSHWARREIQELAAKNIIGGYPDGTFKPNKKINRAEFITLVCRMFDLQPENNEADFSDVAADAWYAGYINAIKQAGVVGGYEDGTFRPDQEITREEAFVILYRIAKNELDITGSNTEFADEEDIAGWAKEAVKSMIEAGVVSGYEDGTIKPKNTITRAETAKILDYFLNLSNN